MAKEVQNQPTVTETVEPTINYDVQVDERVAAVVPQIIDEFCQEDITPPDAKDYKVTKIHSDIYLLFNQQRIEKTIGRDAYRQWVDNLFQRAGTPLPANASFDDIASTIKSRYIQTPSELKAWIDSLDARTQELVLNIKSDAEKKKMQDATIDAGTTADVPPKTE